MFFFFEEKPISLVLWIPRQTVVCQLTLALISPQHSAACPSRLREFSVRVCPTCEGTFRFTVTCALVRQTFSPRVVRKSSINISMATICSAFRFGTLSTSLPKLGRKSVPIAKLPSVKSQISSEWSVDES